MTSLYITHCSKKKDPHFQTSTFKLPPQLLYTATYLQRFVKRCKEVGVEWAIFSDKHGFLYPTDSIAYYEHSPDRVKGDEKDSLFRRALEQLEGYGRVYFYHNPGRFHRLYQELVYYLKEEGVEIFLISHLMEINKVLPSPLSSP